MEQRPQNKWWHLFLNNPVFSFLWLGTLISSFSSFYLLLYVSTLIFEASKSNLKSGAVFATSWILPAILVPLTTQILRTFRTGHVLMCLVVTQAIAAIAILTLLLEFPLFTYLLLAIRGYFSGIELTARQITVKKTLRGISLPQGASLLGTANYLGMILGGVGSALGGKYLSPQLNILFLVTCLVFVAILYQRTIYDSDGRTSTKAATHYFSEIEIAFSELKKERLLPTASRFLVTVAAFQGYHNVARTAYSIDFFGLPHAYISHLQVLTTLSVICGSLFTASFLCDQKKANALASNIPLIITGLFLVSTVLVDHWWLGFLLYSIFIFFFEISYIVFQNKIIVETKSESVISVLSAINAVSVLLLGLSILALGALTDRFGIRAVNISLFVFIFAPIFLMEAIARLRSRADRVIS